MYSRADFAQAALDLVKYSDQHTYDDPRRAALLIEQAQVYATLATIDRTVEDELHLRELAAQTQEIER